MNNKTEQILESMVEYLVNTNEEKDIRKKHKLLERIKNNALSKEDIKRLIGLFKLDTQAILLAFEYGVHPITGCEWNIDKRYSHTWFSNREKDLIILIRRNKEIVEQLEKML